MYLKTKRVLSFMMTIILLSVMLQTNAAAGEDTGDGISTLGSLLPGTYYSVPISIFGGGGTISPTLNPFGTSASRNVINSRALVRPNANGGFDVTLRLESHSMLQFLQVLDPVRREAAKQANGGLYGKIKPGTFNVSSPLKETLLGKGVISEESNGYFLPTEEVDITPASQALDTANVSFTLPDLSEEVLVITYCDPTGSISPATGYQVLLFRPEQAAKLPDGLVYPEGGRTLGFAWTNYYYGSIGTANGMRDNQPAYLAYLNSIVNEDVAVTVAGDGTMSAEFTLNPEVQDLQNRVLKIEVAASRPQPYEYLRANGTFNSSIMSEYRPATYETVYAAGDPAYINGKFMISFENMSFGRNIRITTAATKAENDSGLSEAQTKYVFGHLRLEPQDGQGSDELFEAVQNGVTLRAGDTTVPLTSEFTVETVARYYNTSNEDYRESYRAFARGPEYIKEYTLSLLHEGREVVPASDVSIEIPIPQGWNTDTISAYACAKQGASAFEALTLSNIGVLDKEKRVLRITTKLASRINASYILIDRGAALDLDAAGLEDGLYKVGITLASASNPAQPSMASAAVAGNTGYLEVQNGKKTLYMEMRGIQVMGMKGFVYKLFTYSDFTAKISPSTATPYSYLTEEDGSLFTEWEGIDLYYMQRMSFPLDGIFRNPYGYYVSVIVPKMDSISQNPDGSWGVPGSGAAEKRAYLFINRYEKVADEENPLAGYDKSVILARIADAEKLLPSLGEISAATLKEAVGTARDFYHTGPADSAAVKAAADVLESVIESLRSGEEGIDKAELNAVIGQAEQIGQGSYTEASWNALQAAIAAAKAVNGNADAAQAEVDAQVAALRSAIDALEEKSDTDTSILQDAIESAETYLMSGGSGYEPTSYQALVAATAAARAAKTAIGDTGTSSVQAAVQADALNKSIAALVSLSDLSDSGIADGEYPVQTELMKVGENMLSMGNPAIDHTQSKVVIGEGRAELHLFFQAMTFGQDTGHLLRLWKMENVSVDEWGVIDDGYTLVSAAVYSVWEDVTDAYGPPEGENYPKEVGITVTPGNEYTYVQVYVPVMGSSAQQPARVKIDWSRLGHSSPDMGGLAAALERARSTEQSGYTTLSYTALQAGMEAAGVLKTLTGATQAMIDRRTAALDALVAALLEAEQPGGEDPGTDPGESPGSGGTVDPSNTGKYWVDVNLWNASLNQESMGNAAFENDRALVVTANGGSVLQVATRPVEVSGYTTAIGSVEYDTGSGYKAVKSLKTGKFTTNTKYDGSTHQITYPKVFEINLKSTSDTYVRVRIKVPYTPMDSLAADSSGWINARLKIDWDGISKASNDAELNPPSSISPGSSSLGSDLLTSKVNMTDKATGVRLTAAEGVVPEGAALKVSEIKSGEAYTKAQEALADISAKFKLFDITLNSRGSEVQPKGMISLYFPVPDDFDKSNVALYCINSDGTAARIEGSISDSGYVAKLSHLSLYALTETLGVAASGDRFTDTAKHWARDAINFAVGKGLFNGTSDTTFSPDSGMTRGMFVTILGRLSSVDASKYKTGSFADVDAVQYYAPYVAWAAENKIAGGTGGGRFDPESTVTREQAAVMLANYRAFAGLTEAEPAEGMPENGVYTVRVEALKEKDDEYSMANQFFTEKGRIAVAGDELTLSLTWHATQHITMDMIKELRYFTADGTLTDVNRTLAADGSSMTVSVPLESLDKAAVLQAYVPDGMGEIRPNFRLVLKKDTLEKAEAEFADDTEISSWAKGGVLAMQLAGLFKGDDSSNFNPKKDITRAEAAVILARNLGFAG